MIKVVLFDLGHTLTKTVDVRKKIEALLIPYNLSWEEFYPHWRNFYYLRSTGKISNDKEMFLLLEKVLGRKNIPFRKIRDIIIFESHIIPKENIKIIKELKRKYKVGLITNFVYEWIKKVFRSEGIDNLFDILIASSKMGVRKPTPKVFYITLKSFLIKPAEAVFVSDDLYSDLICAKGCGIKTIWLDKGIKNRWDKQERKIAELFPPDAIIKNLKEITSVLKRM
jgi:putative hydrolase of the HAD superfamily